LVEAVAGGGNQRIFLLRGLVGGGEDCRRGAESAADAWPIAFTGAY